MANTQVLQRDFSGGFAQDFPRDQMPPGKVWYAENSISSADGVSIERRGGTTYFSGTLANLGTWVGAEQPDGSGWSDVLVGVASVSSSGRVLSVNSAGTVTNRAAIPAGGGAPSLRMTNFNQKVIASAGGTSNKPFSINSSYTLATLTNATSSAQDLCAHKDRLVLAINSGTTSRTYFSSPLDETTWDNTYGWIGFQDYIGAIRSVNGMLLVWTPSYLYRVRGSTPPPARDMIVEPIMRNPGVVYPYQVAVKESLAFWVSDAGVYATDGTSTIDLTEKCGIKDWWIQARVDEIAGSGGVPNIGVYQNFVIAGYVNTNAASLKYAVIDFRKYQTHVWRFGNPTGYNPAMWVNGASSFFAGEETYVLYDSSSHRWESISDCFNPAAANKSDASGTFTWRVETPFYGLGHPGLKRLKNMYVAHDLRDAASDNPTVTPSYITSPENTSYTDLTALSETTAYKRERRSLNKLAHGVAFKFTGTNPASASKLYSLELESHNLEHSRRAQ